MTDASELPCFKIRPLTAEEGGGYLIEFPDYPGCIADCETPEDAVREGHDAFVSYAKTLNELDRPTTLLAEGIGRRIGS
ncbi:type II toxin-antitoxin system HicB family antitoxin [Mesorhizobium sp. LHD-90]|uniref:type II toxin-antitoxin system HicB family antitoxin n=1 Tax=Mesorhizobium sp. LHD-90 TaxID=3071414 RepID=UPI0027DED183|nr:type II toxin-antitoxin system HicB family antitoxin [Mesorhizobium sp. LHD-90]MDQ6435155.1 type II toxin-antitoxin system HicB family antitoxin [Mesorhizobium sp. LHD-90]